MSEGGVNSSRRYLLTAATAAVGAVGVAGAAVPFLSSWQPSAQARAAGAPVKFDASKLEPGQQAVVEWQGKPVFVVRRTPEELRQLEATTVNLADRRSDRSTQPESARNDYRSIQPEVLVVIGLCTHLGCSPKFYPEVKPEPFDTNWQGGYFCPCHGSKYDLAGRVYAGQPAPDNLPVPPYYFVDDNVMIIGEEAPA
jgi:ubiquinol-cytochrome c reductase iron-sulfur subunit